MDDARNGIAGPMHRASLRFRDESREAGFWKHHHASSIVLLRVAWFMGIALYTVFGLVLAMIAGTGGGMITGLYFGFAVPLLAACLVSTFWSGFERWRLPLIMASLAISTGVVNAPFFLAQLPKDLAHSSNMVLVCFTFPFVVAPFRFMLVNAAVTTLAYLASVSHLVDGDAGYAIYSATCYVSVLLVSLSAGYLLERSYKRNYLQALEVEQQRSIAEDARSRSDALLLNILPSSVAEELKRTGASDARHHEEVSVLFSDFVHFTAVSERLDARDLVKELDQCFKAFDAIMDDHGIEKIKTIGDAYMAAGGLQLPVADAASRTVLAALEMQGFMEARHGERTALGLPAFRMRIGIHTGPVVAGIVGAKKFQYDIWGDTVNTASRMESSGEVGRVNISEATYALVKHGPGLSFTPRGKVHAKGKGEMEMFFVSAEA